MSIHDMCMFTEPVFYRGRHGQESEEGKEDREGSHQESGKEDFKQKEVAVSATEKLPPPGRNPPWEEKFEIARKGAFPALTQMREEGIIKGWGLGVNRPEPIMKLLDVADPDVCLLASQYSLIDHKNALHHVFPAARAKGISFVVGSSLNAGFISGSQRYNYGKENYKIPQPIIKKREQLREVAERHGVDLRTAALQFSATPDIASALVVGAGSQQQIVADYSSMQVRIPAEFWAELKERKLIEQDAPVPA